MLNVAIFICVDDTVTGSGSPSRSGSRRRFHLTQRGISADAFSAIGRTWPILPWRQTAQAPKTRAICGQIHLAWRLLTMSSRNISKR
jgi:hypothetical protein